MAVDTDNALITLADAKEWLRIETADTTYDDVLEEFINSVSIAFNETTGRLLLARDLTEYYDGPGGSELYVASYPINSITALYVDAGRDYTAATEVTEYVKYDKVGLVRLVESGFGESPQEIKIEYNAGYAIADVPADLRKACLDQVKHEFRRWKNNTEGLRSMNTGDGSIALEEVDLLDSVERVLRHYRNWNHDLYS